MVSVPPTSLDARRSVAIASTVSGQGNSAGTTDSSTLESAVFTPWPPGPDEREKFHRKDFAGTIRPPVTTRSP